MRLRYGSQANPGASGDFVLSAVHQLYAFRCRVKWNACTYRSLVQIHTVSKSVMQADVNYSCHCS